MYQMKARKFCWKCLFRHNAVSLGKQLLIFWRLIVPAETSQSVTQHHVTAVLQLLRCWCESCLSHRNFAFNILHFKTLRVICRWWELMYFCVIVTCSGINQTHWLLFVPNKHYARNTFRGTDYCHQKSEVKYLLITVSLDLSLITILIWFMFPSFLLVVGVQWDWAPWFCSFKNTIVPAPDDWSVCSIGGLISGRKELKF